MFEKVKTENYRAESLFAHDKVCENTASAFAHLFVSVDPRSIEMEFNHADEVFKFYDDKGVKGYLGLMLANSKVMYTTVIQLNQSPITAIEWVRGFKLLVSHCIALKAESIRAAAKKGKDSVFLERMGFKKINCSSVYSAYELTLGGTK